MVGLRQGSMLSGSADGARMSGWADGEVTHRSFEEVWQSLQELKDTTVRTLVRGCPNRILHFDSTGMTRQRCRNGVSWGSPKEKDWELPTAVPIGIFQQLWDILSERMECEVPKVQGW